jgi:hypothetical protein
LSETFVKSQNQLVPDAIDSSRDLGLYVSPEEWYEWSHEGLRSVSVNTPGHFKKELQITEPISAAWSADNADERTGTVWNILSVNGRTITRIV